VKPVTSRANKPATDATYSLRTIAKQNEEIIRLNKLLVAQQTPPPPKPTGWESVVPSRISHADDADYWIARYRTNSSGKAELPAIKPQRNLLVNWLAGIFVGALGAILLVFVLRLFDTQ